MQEPATCRQRGPGTRRGTSGYLPWPPDLDSTV